MKGNVTLSTTICTSIERHDLGQTNPALTLYMIWKIYLSARSVFLPPWKDTKRYNSYIHVRCAYNTYNNASLSHVIRHTDFLCQRSTPISRKKDSPRRSMNRCDLKRIYITEIYLKKEYKSSIIKNHKITNIFFFLMVFP